MIKIGDEIAVYPKEIMQGISFIIVNYYTSHLVEKLIRSIKRFDSANVSDIIVIDNTTDVKARFGSKIKNVRIHYTNRNLGFGKACNIGAKLALHENIIFINPDSLLFEPKFHPKLIESFNKFPKNTIFTGRVLNKNKKQVCNTFKFSNFINIYFENTIGRIVGISIPLLSNKANTYLETSEAEIDWVSGAFLCIKKEFFFELGGFDEQLFMYEEDAELCFHARQRNGKVIFNPQIAILHLGGEASKKNKELLSFIGMKSSLYFYEKRNNKIKPILLNKFISMTWHMIYLNFMILAHILPSIFFKRKIFWKNLLTISRKHNNTPIKDLVDYL